MMSELNQEESTLNIEFVDKAFYLARIKHFEQQYQMDWPVFRSKYEELIKQVEEPQKEADFVEWAFLCSSYKEDLISNLILDEEGPPPTEFSASEQKPDLESGFLFGSTRASSFAALLTAL